MSTEQVILQAPDIDRILTRITHELLEKHRGTENLLLIGIWTGGVFLADRIAARILSIDGTKIPRGDLDITLYRDDWTRIGHQPIVRKTEIPFSLDGKQVVLVDDVLFTGRTVRAAMDALIDFGRPDRIELAVLVDRGHRELPIQANYVGKHIETIHNTMVNVYLKERAGRDEACVTM
ncbi:MAG: bifunctional pyr operon transcriptional regulator/uracil phosphoribosyltransferase PyrR [Deltaproteobacteria bacterium]|nr:bifunctional pyr operon transcriptional regulator/uracil phosphoribosyltransferase PyrR [Deltaproteobacteria bacterium]MBW2265570.1 bifunctional pyr operon transcriptional regulator/uracil phosphoribosyltransferase PyrR [Deltaproteobacteria bacterium]OEU45120.1 MAG: bifunctional pyr operon transcriptional regulator/uracil phosphoribosyltransferase [Desulfobacterales bacterium S7086C20]